MQQKRSAPAVPKPAAVKKFPRKTSGDTGAKVLPEQRLAMIREAAYYRALSSGFDGDPVEHWLAAERQIDQVLRGT
jgi:hypothetical protein